MQKIGELDWIIAIDSCRAQRRTQDFVLEGA